MMDDLKVYLADREEEQYMLRRIVHELWPQIVERIGTPRSRRELMEWLKESMANSAVGDCHYSWVSKSKAKLELEENGHRVQVTWSELADLVLLDAFRRATEAPKDDI